METGNTPPALRIISGILAVAGIGAMGSQVATMLSGNELDGWRAALLVGGCYGIFLFGSYAATGKLPLKTGSGKA